MKDNIERMMELATHMDAIATCHCVRTECNNDRMRSATDIDDCEWYHAGWLYCRLAGIIISKDYLNERYKKFFSQRLNKDRIDVLICGFADHALLTNIIATIPKTLLSHVHFTLMDICRSPIELCQLYVKKFAPELTDRVTYVQGDATNINMISDSFDLITTYSFLTRMSKPLMTKVLKEWLRLLKGDGEILTTVRVTADAQAEETFHRGSAASIEFGMEKVEKFLMQGIVNDQFADRMRQRTYAYLTNIMSSTLKDSSILSVIADRPHEVWYYDQPGELESIHKMMGLSIGKGASK